MEYFYTPLSNIFEHFLTIDGDEFEHLTRVLRKQPGDAIRVVDGVGVAYEATIREIARDNARCAIHSRHMRLHEPDVDVTLGVALLKNSSKFDFLVEKCTELGVNTIVPLLTERTIPQHAKVERWLKLALAAMKQSERCVLPAVHNSRQLKEFIAAVPSSSLRFIPHEKISTPSLTSRVINQPAASIVLCIGPEGGFSDSEIAAATDAGFLPVSLGPRRLRTETAAIVAVAACLINPT